MTATLSGLSSTPPFPRESPSAIPAEMGASGERQFGSCQLYPRPGQARDKPGGRFYGQTVAFTDL